MSTEIVELRQYLLHSGARDDLLALFDREFVEAQESVGMSVLGQFRDPDRPDYFVWLRGFPDMASRHEALGTFYDGPVWAQHRAAANATMVDSDDVLLLRPWTAADALPVHQPAGRAERTSTGTVFVAIERCEEPDRVRVEQFTAALAGALGASDVRTIGRYVTEQATNTFTRLPVRPENTIVWFGVAEADAASVWTALQGFVSRRGAGQCEVHRLSPTARSALGGTPGPHPISRTA
jgi:NIPSNAP